MIIANFKKYIYVLLPIIALHCIALLILLIYFIYNHTALNAHIFTISLALTAYMLGVRHAFDADHISAIDNTVRKLSHNKDKKTDNIGLFFSLGHSTVVIIASILLIFGIKLIATTNSDTHIHKLLTFFGTITSGVFLYIVAMVNLFTLINIWKSFLRIRKNNIDKCSSLDKQTLSLGFVNKFISFLNKSITNQYQMYLVGFLFGLGFDTASEITLLTITGTTAATSLPWYMVLLLPILFTSGMSLFDTLDSIFMTRAYKWAFSNPLRKIYYNLTVTGLSIFIAFIIGTIELTKIIVDKISIHNSLLLYISNINLDYIGYMIVALFICTWILSTTIWKFKYNNRLNDYSS